MSRHIGDEIFSRLQRIQEAELETALTTSRKLRGDEIVSDGELLDALYWFTTNLDIANPLLPVCHETLRRFMVFAGITETPRGIKREWLECCSNPNCIDGKVSIGCSVDGPLLTTDCPDCVKRSKPATTNRAG